MRVNVNPSVVLWLLLLGALILGALHILTRFMELQGVGGVVVSLILDLFNMNLEVSIPTWYSQILLLFAGFVAVLNCVAHRQQGKKYAWHWLFIAVVLLAMSLDEGSQVHEIANLPLQVWLESEGTLLHYAWILAAGFLVLVVAAVLLKFWWQLPVRVRVIMAAAALTFVVGSMGFEIVGGQVQQRIGHGMLRTVINMLEETLEMVGAILATYAFLLHLRHVSPVNTIELVGSGASR